MGSSSLSAGQNTLTPAPVGLNGRTPPYDLTMIYDKIRSSRMFFSSSRRLFRRDPVPGDAKPICLRLHMQNRTQKAYHRRRMQNRMRKGSLPVYLPLRTLFRMPQASLPVCPRHHTLFRMPQVSPPVSRLLHTLSRMRKRAPHLPFFSIRRDLRVP